MWLCHRYNLLTPSNLKLVPRLNRTVLGKATHRESHQRQDMMNLVIVTVYYIVFPKDTTFCWQNVSHLYKDAVSFGKPHRFSVSLFTEQSLCMALQLGWMCLGFNGLDVEGLIFCLCLNHVARYLKRKTLLPYKN